VKKTRKITKRIVQVRIGGKSIIGEDVIRILKKGGNNG